MIVSNIVTAEIAILSRWESVSLSTNTPTGTAAMPANAMGPTRLTGSSSRFWATIRTKSNRETVLTTTMTVCGSKTNSSNGMVVIPIPNPTVESTVEPKNMTTAAIADSIRPGM